MMRSAIIFAQFGPYHHARVAALQVAMSTPVIPVQIASGTSTYGWKETGRQCTGLQTLFHGVKEDLSPVRVFIAAIKLFRQEKIRLVLLPSYAPAPEFALFVAAKLLGLSTLMMNDSHAGTEKAQGWKKRLKRWIVGGFDAALVAGEPQRRHFVSLGIPEDRIFTGYDAVDNDCFAQGARDARADEAGVRETMQLPLRYFLSLGRMVEKKNLGLLIEAYAHFSQRSTEPVALALVGSGEEELMLRSIAQGHRLRIHDAKDITPEDRSKLGNGDVIFYGFRQIDENPSFYALAETFILPSLWEEWGLVVNEAMACGIPVLISGNVGCAEDLVMDGQNGYVFNPTDSQELAEQLAMLANNESLRTKMGKESEKIISNWGCDNFAKNAVKAVGAATSIH